MYRTFLVCFLLFFALFSFAQNNTSINDPEAAALLKTSSEKYKKMGGLQTDFSLTIVSPKQKPEDPDSKHTETQRGQLWLKEKAFKISLNGNEIICNGKDIWTYISKQNECQLNEYIESDEVFSPTQLFNLYEANFSYQIKEKKTIQGKKITVLELIPSNKKSSYFKLDVSLNDSNEITEVKVYEKNGVRYFYKPENTAANPKLPSGFFSFDNRKYPNVHIEDLR